MCSAFTVHPARSLVPHPYLDRTMDSQPDRAYSPPYRTVPLLCTDSDSASHTVPFRYAYVYNIDIYPPPVRSLYVCTHTHNPCVLSTLGFQGCKLQISRSRFDGGGTATLPRLYRRSCDRGRCATTRQDQSTHWQLLMATDTSLWHVNGRGSISMSSRTHSTTLMMESGGLSGRRGGRLRRKVRGGLMH
ncbi:hypothetical protein OH76DRAFT_219185 [Lentinus brumalis]|uniref:Uncharacterized protein n=1 Tax=Lentinus brumalis TaxID=2498619 RepID=A0A371CM71_9APHY|nr:hypothetical protein OH76DRAFT_219185 [Polyporus brumalis]